jgi:hypothetical protein
MMSSGLNVKTSGAPGSMLVRHLGKPVARTDGDGKASVVLEGDVLDRIDLTLDTNDPSFAKLHPQSPVGS